MEIVVVAQEEGSLDPAGDLDDIVDLIMGIYLIALFEWSHIDEYSYDFLKDKLYRFFNTILGEHLRVTG